ncbi:hypothetical protein EIP91_007382 [Steccherinum ochraceum]|uniref:Uncharacterized protein n=1 Tax=Steccherinum ochraceum TaxID=92696 RepID=A0A4R0RXD6_9APHY|nr:hypothetical protein EIP91_007382 [Steccherinum ochraceum]
MIYSREADDQREEVTLKVPADDSCATDLAIFKYGVCASPSSNKVIEASKSIVIGCTADAQFSLPADGLRDFLSDEMGQTR